MSQENHGDPEQPFLNLDPRFQARLVFQDELQSMTPNQAGQFCDLCDEPVVQHRWAIVDGLGFIVIACANTVDNNFERKDS